MDATTASASSVESVRAQTSSSETIDEWFFVVVRDTSKESEFELHGWHAKKEEWASLCKMPPNFAASSAISRCQRFVAVTGGETAPGAFSFFLGRCWNEGPPLVQGRFGHAMAEVKDCLVVVGGCIRNPECVETDALKQATEETTEDIFERACEQESEGETFCELDKTPEESDKEQNSEPILGKLNLSGDEALAYHEALTERLLKVLSVFCGPLPFQEHRQESCVHDGTASNCPDVCEITNNTLGSEFSGRVSDRQRETFRIPLAYQDPRVPAGKIYVKAREWVLQSLNLPYSRAPSYGKPIGDERCQRLQERAAFQASLNLPAVDVPRFDSTPYVRERRGGSAQCTESVRPNQKSANLVGMSCSGLPASFLESPKFWAPKQAQPANESVKMMRHLQRSVETSHHLRHSSVPGGFAHQNVDIRFPAQNTSSGPHFNMESSNMSVFAKGNNTGSQLDKADARIIWCTDLEAQSAKDQQQWQDAISHQKSNDVFKDCSVYQNPLQTEECKKEQEVYGLFQQLMLMKHSVPMLRENGSRSDQQTVTMDSAAREKSTDQELPDMGRTLHSKEQTQSDVLQGPKPFSSTDFESVPSVSEVDTLGDTDAYSINPPISLQSLRGSRPLPEDRQRLEATGNGNGTTEKEDTETHQDQHNLDESDSRIRTSEQSAETGPKLLLPKEEWISTTSVEIFQKKRNEWQSHGDLVRAVRCCEVALTGSTLLILGREAAEASDLIVQTFNVQTKAGVLANFSLPRSVDTPVHIGARDDEHFFLSKTGTVHILRANDDRATQVQDLLLKKFEEERRTFAFYIESSIATIGGNIYMMNHWIRELNARDKSPIPDISLALEIVKILRASYSRKTS